jgi:hypothetical protein
LYTSDRSDVIWAPDDIAQLKKSCTAEIGFAADLAACTGLRETDLGEASSERSVSRSRKRSAAILAWGINSTLGWSLVAGRSKFSESHTTIEASNSDVGLSADPFSDRTRSVCWALGEPIMPITIRAQTRNRFGTGLTPLMRWATKNSLYL